MGPDAAVMVQRGVIGAPRIPSTASPSEATTTLASRAAMSAISDDAQEFGDDDLDRLHGFDLSSRKAGIDREPRSDDVFLAFCRPGERSRKLATNSLSNTRLDIEDREKYERQRVRCDPFAQAGIARVHVESVRHEAGRQRDDSKLFGDARQSGIEPHILRGVDIVPVGIEISGLVAEDGCELCIQIDKWDVESIRQRRPRRCLPADHSSSVPSMRRHVRRRSTRRHVS